MSRSRAFRYAPYMGVIALAVLAIAPHLAFADAGTLQSGFTIVPDVCNCAQGAGWGCVLSVFQNLTTFVVYIGVLGAVAAMAYAGFLMVTNATNPGNIGKARTAMLDAVIGLVIVLAAWLIVNTLVSTLTTGTLTSYSAVLGSTSGNCLPTAVDQTGTSQGTNTGLTGSPGSGSGGCPGSLICTSGTCQQDPQLDNGSGEAGQPCKISGGNCNTSEGLICDASGTCSASSAAAPTIPSSCTSATAAPGVGNGVCSVASGGPCDPGSMAGFGSQANQASEICLAESSGNPSIPSGSDVMRNDPQHRAFSFGLFQINLTQHQVGGLNCPSAFSGTNYSATVVNESLYAQCVTAVKDPNQNIAVALQMWSQDGQSFREWSTHTKCGIALANWPQLAIAICDTISL